MRKTRLFLYFCCVLILSPVISLFLFPLADVSAAPLAKLQVLSLSDTPDPFSPNNDGRLDVVTITSALNIEGTGQTAQAILKGELAVNDASGNRVSSLTIGKSLSLAIGKSNETAFSTGWDGKTSSGEIAADGTYLYTVDLSLLKGCKGNGDNQDDLHSGNVDLLGDCNSGEGNDTKEERVLTSAQSISGELTVDSTPPAIMVKGISPGISTNKNVTITISIEELHPASLTVMLNNQPFSSGSTLTEEGQYVLLVAARDKAENVAIRSLTFTIDKTPPQIEDLSLEGALLDRSPAEITLKYSDLLSGIEPSSAIFSLNGVNISGSAIVSEASAAYAPDVPMLDGKHRVELTISDKAGNEAKQGFSFTVDSTPPIVNIVSPEEGATIDNSSPEIRINFSDSLSGVDLSSISLSINEIDVSSNAGISEDFLTYVPDPPLGDGTQSLSISVSDRGGNTKEKSIEFLTKTKKRPYIFPEPGFKYGSNRAPETADLNNDGVLDLVIIYDGDRTRVAVMMGKGDGSFEDPKYIIDVNGDDSLNASLALGDFNGDGFVDIAISNVNNRYLWVYEPENGDPRLELQIFLNNKNGSFFTSYKYVDDDLSYQTGLNILTGYFNQDDHKDAAVVSSHGIIFTFLGSGDGLLNDPIKTNVQHFLDISGIKSLDLNSDKTNDIVVSYGNNIFFLIASGDGTFYSIMMEEANKIGDIDFDAIDVDRDGNIDIVFIDEQEDSYSGEIFGYTVLLGDGNGGIIEKKRNSVRLGTNHGYIFLEDVTGNNIVDLLVLSIDNTMNNTGWYGKQIYILEGNGDGTFDDKSPIIVKTNVDGTSMTFADTDKDGFKDILVSSYYSLYTLFGRGDGTFSDRKIINATYGKGDGVISADFDNDKTPDLAIAGGSEGALFTTILNKGSAWTENLFEGSSSYRVGDGPSSVKISDFNGDGKPDIVTTNILSDDVSVLLNDDKGSFRTPVTYPVGERPVSINVEDMNRDGYLDLVVASESAEYLTILLGAGNGTFPINKKIYNNKCSSDDGLSNSLIIEDYNEDNINDIIYFGCIYDNLSNLYVMLGNGDGTFHTKQLSGVIGNHGISGDYNEDGHIDIAITGGGNIKLLFGRGDGTFSNNNISYFNNNTYIYTDDFNNDGHLDIFSSVFYMGSGDGNFEIKTIDELTSIGIYTKIGDINGDGKTDLFIDDFESLGVWVARSDGTFEKKTLVDYLNWHNNSYHLMFGNTIDVGDINGDSISDIVFVDGVSLYVLPGSGNGLFPVRTAYIEGDWEPGDNVTAADFNGDAYQDIAVSISNGAKHGVAIYYGKGNNTFISGAIIDTGDASFIKNNKVFSKDINNDGYPDILYQQISVSNNNNDYLYVLINNSGVTFSEPILYEIESGSNLVFDDIDNDGYVDLVNSFSKNISYGYYSNSVSIHKGSGDGFFHYVTTLPITNLTSSSHVYIAVHDLNGDGNSDLAVTTNETYNLLKPQLLIYINSGGGTFSGAPIVLDIKNEAGPLLAGDFDQDGMIDLILYGFQDILFLGGNGDGTFKDEVAYAANSSWNSSIISEDFNLDGRPDLVSEAYPSLILHLNMLPPLKTPPATPNNLKADSGDSVVTLSWNGSTEVDIEGYNIYRAPVSGGAYEKINSGLVSSPAFADAAVTNGIEYYYTVSAVDAGGEESSFAFKVVAKPDIPDTIAPVVKITTPLRNQTTYNPSIFVSGTVSETGAKVFVNDIQGTVQQTGTFTAYGVPLDIGENTVSVTAVDAAGNHSSSDSVTVVYSPPATMDGIIKDEVTGQPIQYTHVRVTDAEKSQEFFVTSADGKYSFVKIIPGEVTISVESQSLTYYDPVTITKTISSGANLHLDIALPLYPATIKGWLYDANTSNYLSNATITIKDPKKTQTLSANTYGYVESFNVTPYQITITVASAGYQTHTETVNVTNRWNNYFYFYLDPLPPTPPAGLTATPGKGFVELAWNAGIETNLANYQLYRSTTPGTGYQLIASFSSNEPSYADGDVVAGTVYYYGIKAINTSAQPSGYSTEVSAAPDALPVPAGLTATPGKELVSLAWGADTGSHIGSYNIYRAAEAGGDFALIGSVAAPTTAYTDTNVDAGVTYIYVVSAVNAWSREGGRSNAVSAVPEAVSVGVTITSPYNGAYSATSTVLVKGTVESGDSPEVGVVLVVESRSREGILSSSYLAEVNNGSFAAQISLYPGMQSTIRAIATLPDGVQAYTAIALYAGMADEAVRLTTLPANGILSAQTRTFDVTFEAEVNVAGTITNYAWDFDGDGNIDQVTSTPAATFAYTRPGIFYPVVTVTVDAGSVGGVPPKGGPSGMAYTATTVVNVMSMEKMDALLKTKWNAMKQTLATGDIEKTMSFFSDASQEKYRGLFTYLHDKLPEMAVEMNNIQLIYLRDGRAKYRIRRMEERQEITYYIYFHHLSDGLWKIHQF